MKNKLLLFGALFSMSALFAQTSIDDARNFPVGATVTIKGVSSDSGELGPIRYIQDATGGIPIYGSMANGVNRGDSVTLTGVIKDFSGLLEIDPITSLTPNGAGTEIAPWNINIVDLGNTYEGRLVRIDNVTFPTSGAAFANSTNYNFTDGTNTGTLRINSGTAMAGQTIPGGAQSVVGLLSEYNGLFQLLPRDINDIFGYTAPDKKIEVLVDGTPVLNGATIQIGTTASTPIELKNIGVNNLTVSAINFAGAAAADFSTNLVTGAIAGAGSVTGNIAFSTTVNGSRISTIAISSDDPTDPVFTLNLYGIGNDNLATEPSFGTSIIGITNVQAYTMNVQSHASFDGEGFLILWKEGSTPTGVPVDGTSYLRGDVIGDSKVAYVGNSETFTPRGIRADIDYHFAVYVLNGYGNFVNYNQTDVAIDNQMSSGSNIGSYYGALNTGTSTLTDDLTALINPHNYSSYFLYKTLLMDGFEALDTLAGESYITCVYSGEKKVYSGSFDWTATGYSREHTYAHSWFPTNPANGTPEELEYADYHNLYPTNLNKANTPRSNLPFGEIVGTPAFTYLEGSRGQNASGSLVYEPRDQQKGNLARSIFYMATAYNGASGTGDNWGMPSNQEQDVLKKWHFDDVPDSYEIARHELIYSIQNNRNPYIDSADFACYVDFYAVSYISEGCELGLSSNFIENNLSIFPNPSNEIVYVQLNGVKITSINVTDMTGRTVGTFTAATEFVEVDVTKFNAGTYLLNINTEKGNLVKRIIVQ
ncbi:T9SS type A sorting domain-containing protein [Brumimicrobium glaciale]|uniref:T9SS type A sorting domain-containing protein n=1 Tax=Brumimicrobium glaciale TaxID=200475 RepID=A0A4Q4KN23_9FLAO|nr:endonuclease [Brumimicrobium glaciale]RYM34833.1 T9SS type A sorting domain-containing protein [Brumimicrobium glaciale]